MPSGAFNSSTFEQGFAIQDHTAGIYVSVPANLGFGLRQQVRRRPRLETNSFEVDPRTQEDIRILP